MSAPTLLDLALAIRDLDDRQNWSPAAQATAERAMALAEQIINARGWSDEQDIDRNAYSGPHLADEDPDASYLISTPRWPAEAVAA